MGKANLTTPHLLLKLIQIPFLANKELFLAVFLGILTTKFHNFIHFLAKLNFTGVIAGIKAAIFRVAHLTVPCFFH